jgi:hypothetical protein
MAAVAAFNSPNGMAATSTSEQHSAVPATAAPATRKFKASDLPLPSATRAAIDSLAHAFKKKGGYDTIRKQAWDKLAASVSTRRARA